MICLDWLSSNYAVSSFCLPSLQSRGALPFHWGSGSWSSCLWGKCLSHRAIPQPPLVHGRTKPLPESLVGSCQVDLALLAFQWGWTREEEIVVMCLFVEHRSISPRSPQEPGWRCSLGTLSRCHHHPPSPYQWVLRSYHEWYPGMSWTQAGEAVFSRVYPFPVEPLGRHVRKLCCLHWMWLWWNFSLGSRNPDNTEQSQG